MEKPVEGLSEKFCAVIGVADTRMVLRDEQKVPDRVRDGADNVLSRKPVDASIKVPTSNNASFPDGVPPAHNKGTVPLIRIGPLIEVGPAFWARAGLAKASPVAVNTAKDVNAKVRKAIFQYPLF